MKQNETINYLSEFIEKPESHLFGFTITYKNGIIENYFVTGNKFENSKKIDELKKLYEKVKKLKKTKK